MPTKIFDEFYYTESGSACHYGEQITGEFDVQRMIDQKPAWIQPAPLVHRKPKTLILSDSFFRQHDLHSNKKKDVIRKLKQLCQDGFTLHVWTKDGLQDLTESLLEKIYWHDSMKTSSSEEILAAASKHHISRDSIHILDDYWLDCLYHDKVLPEKRLYTSNFVVLEEEAREDVIRTIKANKPEVAVLVQDMFCKSKLPIEIEQELQAAFPGARQEAHWRYLVCQKAQLIGLLSPQATSIIIDNIRFDSNALSEIEAIVLCLNQETFSTAELTALCRVASHLKSLDLSYGIFGPEEPLLEAGSLSQLESLGLKKSSITSESLAALLKATPHLMRLDLIGCKGITEALLLDEGNLSQLESLDLRDSSITSESLSALLKATPSLKTLKLSNCKGITEALLLDEGNLSQLESLDLSGSAITSESLAALLKAAPRLKILKVSGCRGIHAPLTLQPGSLSQLKKIDPPLRLSKENLEILANAAPQLRDIIFREHPVALAPNSSVLKPSASVGILSPSTPRHDSEGYKALTPHDESAPFVFNQQDMLKNQGMVINKLCQYLTLTNQHVAIIPKIQDGICNALSHLYKKEGYEVLNGLIERAHAWNGDANTINKDLSASFMSLYDYIRDYQLMKPAGTTYSFLGCQTKLYLNSLPIKSHTVLKNPWHTVVVEKISEDRYRFYDPNATEIQILQIDALVAALNIQIGALIHVECPDAKVPDVDITQQGMGAFIESGGLWALCMSSNFSHAFIDGMTTQVETLKKNQLDGILLRSVDGTPALFDGLNHQNPAIRELSEALLKGFKAAHLEKSDELLSKSMEAMKSMQRPSLAESLSQQEVTLSEPAEEQAKPNVFRDEVLALCRRTQAKKSYQEQLSPWLNQALVPVNAKAYSQMLLQPGDSTVNRLVRCSSDESVLELGKLLVSYAERTRQPVFYVDAPEHLICASPYVERDGHAVSFKKGPGGALHDFLEKYKTNNPPPVIVVNYTRFNASDMVKFNSVLDTVNPRADGTAIPDRTRVLGLLNTKAPDVYQGSDFYSRFREKHDNPFSIEALEGANGKAVAFEEEKSPSDKTVIDLFHAPDWKSRLLGACVLHGKTMHYEPGALLPVLESGAPFIIKNGLWDDAEFCSFWSHLTIGQGVYHAGAWYKMNKHQEMMREEGYAWDALLTQMMVHDRLSPETYPVLNQQTLPKLLGGYVYNEQEKGLVQQPGVISSHDESTLHLNVTSDLSDDAWALLLTQCHEKRLALELHCGPGVGLPESFGYTKPEVVHLQPFQVDETASAPIPAFRVMVSTDRDTTLRILQDKQPDSMVMSVSGLAPDNFLESIESHFNQETAELNITRKVGALVDALKQDKPVILTGDFSPALVQAITAFVLTQATQPPITLLTEEGDALSCFSDRAEQHQVTLDEKRRYLGQHASEKLGEQILATEPLSRIQARLRYMEAHEASRQGDEAWAGMHRLSTTVRIDAAPLDFNQSAQEAQAFHEGRLREVEEGLLNNPYVYLTGLTGVGKTTFIAKNFSKEKGYALYHEGGSIAAWAKADASENPTLFLDEANMSAQDWAIFEGLFHTPAHIIEKGVYHEISPRHKIIFAGNPSSYGDERKKSLFFERHGSAVLFQPLSKAVLYEDVLKPVFENQGVFSEHDIQASCQDILAAYALVCQQATDEVLLTPRELQMIALLGLSNAKTEPRALQACVQGAILSITGPALHGHSALLAKLKTRFPSVTERPATPIADTFSVVPSQAPILSQLQTYLSLRELRVSTQADLNASQLYGGLGGMVLEGEPGSGKSELVVHALVAAGYTEEHNHYEATQQEKPFYKLSASLGLSQKKALLAKAFQEGAVVIMDEINSSPMMEHTLNAMLMGFHPETHERPAKPGFMVLGTQNPISMAGRRVASPALRRRLTTIEVPEYTQEELVDVLKQQKNLDSGEASLVVEAYLERRTYAKKNHLTPVPCFRDLFTLAHKTDVSSPAIKSASTAEEKTDDAVKYNTTSNFFKSKPEQKFNLLVEDGVDWNFYLKCLSYIAIAAGGAMLVVGLLLPVPGLAIAGACLLGAGLISKY